MTKTTEPKGGSQKIEPKGGSQKIECKMIVPKSGSKNKNKRVGGSNPPSQANMNTLNKMGNQETAHYKQKNNAYNQQKRARNTFEWWVSVYYYLLFKYKYPKFINKPNSDTEEQLDRETLKNLSNPEYNELLRYLFHAGDGNLSHNDPNPAVIRNSTLSINYYVSKKIYHFFEAQKSNIAPPDSLINHCYKQFKNGRDNLDNFGIFEQDNITLLALFIHYTINNFKQIKAEQGAFPSETLNKHLQIFYIAPGISSLYLTPNFEFMNYPGVLYHYIEVIKTFDIQQMKKNYTQTIYPTKLNISRHINNLPGSNLGMADDLFVSDINKNLNGAYDNVKIKDDSFFKTLVFEKNITLQNILEMKTKYQDYYSALKDGWFGNNKSNDFFNIRKSMFNFFKLW